MPAVTKRAVLITIGFAACLAVGFVCGTACARSVMRARESGFAAHAESAIDMLELVNPTDPRIAELRARLEALR